MGTTHTTSPSRSAATPDPRLPDGDQAQPGCPPWCTDHVPGNSYGLVHHRSAYQHFSAGAPQYSIGVGLHQIEPAADDPGTLYVGGVPFSLSGRGHEHVKRLVALLCSLGRDDIADAAARLPAARRRSAGRAGRHTVSAGVFAAVFAAYAAGHQAGDYWVQTSAQAAAKDQDGWTGRRACAAHVATYTLTLAACLALVSWWLTLPLHVPWVSAGLALSAVTHYAADRRAPLRCLAGRLGCGEFWGFGEGLASGAAHLDLLCTTGGAGAGWSLRLCCGSVGEFRPPPVGQRWPHRYCGWGWFGQFWPHR
jgi:hypothetical protein